MGKHIDYRKLESIFANYLFEVLKILSSKSTNEQILAKKGKKIFKFKQSRKKNLINILGILLLFFFLYTVLLFILSFFI